MTLIVLAVFVPFLPKPFNIDDPLFLWAARQIQAHPTDPYGFSVNWGWTAFPMWKVTENPPLACYYLALAAFALGWNEIALHSAFLLPALAVILGTYRLAKLFCTKPMQAAFITLFTPVFLVSANSVMCDVMMLAFWIWAVVFWVEGLEQRNFERLAVASVLMSLAMMTKYYAFCLMPLLAAYSLARRQPLKNWAQFLLIPLAVLCAYQYLTAARYGYSLLYRAMDYASFSKDFFNVSKTHSFLTALAFAGGCSGLVAWFVPALWGRRGLIIFIIGLILIGAGLGCPTSFWAQYGGLTGSGLTLAKIQMTFWVAGGLGWLILALADLAIRRDASSLLLTLWLGGTFYFTAFCNWTINARSILPMMPAAAILLVRQLERRTPASPKIVVTGAIVTALFGLAVLRADFLQAAATRDSVLAIRTQLGPATTNVWFEGHWGFQYYMQAAGASPVDFKHPALRPGQMVALPANNTNIKPLDQNNAVLLGTVTVPVPSPLATWDPSIGAGFYASVWGPLPFAFGKVPPGQVSLYLLKPDNSGK